MPACCRQRGSCTSIQTGSSCDSGYFATLRIPLIAGRDFTDADRAGTQNVAIIGAGAARQLFPGKSAIGQVVQIHTGSLQGPNLPSTPLLVVGVVGDLALPATGPVRTSLDLYVPVQQKYVSGITILARTGGPASVADEIRRLVASMNPNLPVLSAQTLESARNGPVETQLRIAAVVAGSVGFVGVLLAAVGIYGVTAYTLARRTREIGIRVALGAGRLVVVRMVLRQGMMLVGIGLGVGVVLGAAAGRVLSAQRFGITAPGVMTFATAALVFAAVGLIACYVPLRRATRIGAMEALRYE